MSSDIPEIIQKIVAEGLDAVCFDVDSTVCTTEGIDELAAFLGVGEEVSAVTKRAMDGGLSFRDALQQRLEVMKITKDRLDTFVAQHPPVLCPGVKEFMEVLHSRGVKVFLVSGGFTTLIYPILAELPMITEQDVFANKFVFDTSIATFDPNQHTSKTGGKAQAVQAILNTYNFKNVICIGDGITDVESRPPARAVVGYGGIAARPKVIETADWFVYDFATLTDFFLKT